MKGQNVVLLSERNILKKKCGELQGFARTLESSIATMTSKIKEKTEDLGEELENRIKEELNEKLERKKRELTKNQGRRSKSMEDIERKKDKSTEKDKNKKKVLKRQILPINTGYNNEIQYDRMIQTARIQKTELHNQQALLSNMNNYTTNLARALSPRGPQIILSEHLPMTSRGSTRKVTQRIATRGHFLSPQSERIRLPSAQDRNSMLTQGKNINQDKYLEQL